MKNMLSTAFNAFVDRKVRWADRRVCMLLQVRPRPVAAWVGLLLYLWAVLPLSAWASDNAFMNNIGVNSTAPQARLDVEGSSYFGNGNIGVASTAPTQKIDVTGTVRATAFIGNGSALTGITSAGGWTQSGTNVYVTTSTNNVGINSSVPQAKLDIEGSVYIGNGNVGLGTSVPAQKLDVLGSIYVNGNIGVGVPAPTSTLQVRTDGTLAIPQGAAPSVTLAGHIAVDTTADQIVYYGSAERVLNYEMTRCGFYADLSASDIHMSLGAWSQPVTITGVGCTYYGTGTTVATLTLEDGNSNAMTITGTNPTCTANGTAFTFAAVTAGNALNAGQVVRYNVTNTPAPITDDYTICVKYVYTRQ